MGWGACRQCIFPHSLHLMQTLGSLLEVSFVAYFHKAPASIAMLPWPCQLLLSPVPFPLRGVPSNVLRWSLLHFANAKSWERTGAASIDRQGRPCCHLVASTPLQTSEEIIPLPPWSQSQGRRLWPPSWALLHSTINHRQCGVPPSTNQPQSRGNMPWGGG